MKVLLFGATGMIGQGALRECLLDAGVERVTTVGRRATGRQHARLRELELPDLADLSSIEGELAGYDACFYCVGVSSAGLSEPRYRRLTVDLTMNTARTLARLNPGMTFVLVSGAGADSTGRGRVMWARVKGEAENGVLQLPLNAYIFRPAFVQPLHGITSRTPLYRVLYAMAAPLYPLWKAIVPRYVTTTERIGQAMLAVARNGAPQRVLENADINSVYRGQA